MIKVKLFEAVDLLWATLIIIAGYIIAWISLPTIISIPKEVSINNTFIVWAFEKYSAHPYLYILAVLLIDFAISVSLYCLVKVSVYKKYSNVYDTKAINKRFAEFCSDATALKVFGGDLSFLVSSPEQLNVIKKLNRRCKILCWDTNSDASQSIYHDLIKSGVDLRKYDNNDNEFANLRGQIKTVSSGDESSLLTNAISLNGRTHFEVISLNNKHLTGLINQMFLNIHNKSGNPLIKLVLFDTGGVYFNGDINNGFLRKINRKLHTNLTAVQNERILLDEQLNTGKIDIATCIENKIGRELTDNEKTLVTNTWKNTWYLNKDVQDIAKQIKDKGYMVGVCSNLDLVNDDYYDDKGYFTVFSPEHRYLSNRMELTKPSIAFFESVIQKSKLDPHQILLIDDHDVNIQTAKRLNIETIQYSNKCNIQNLYKELKDLRILY